MSDSIKAYEERYEAYEARCAELGIAALGFHDIWSPHDWKLRARFSSKSILPKSPQSMVREFATKFGLPMNARDQYPHELSVERRKFRLELILEELVELFDASGAEIQLSPGEEASAGEQLNEELQVADITSPEYNIIEMADALGDLIYVTYGMAIEMGIDLDAVVTEIHKSNMSKLDQNGFAIINGVTPGYREGTVGFRSDLPIGKVLKSDQYRKPDIASVVLL
jgi:predicted HAD superfamily Cof-like phosphohydrolase